MSLFRLHDGYDRALCLLKVAGGGGWTNGRGKIR